MSKNRVVTVGVIGLSFGKIIAQAFKAVDPSCQVYLAARDYQKAKNVVQEIGANGAFETWQELASDPKIDLVVIASPNNLHREMFEFSLTHNKHILLEKPAAPTSNDIQKMKELSLKNDRIIVVDHEARFHPVILYLKKMVECGELGDILTIRVGAYLNWFSRPDFQGHHILTKASAGGQISMIGVHMIDLARFLSGLPEIKSGSVQTKSFQDPRLNMTVDAETQFAGQFMTADLTSLQLFNDTYCFGYKNFVLEVLGSKGIALYSDTEGLRVSFSNDQPLTPVKIEDPLPHISLGNSLLSRSIKFLASALLASMKTGKIDSRFCTLTQAQENLLYLEKYRQN